MPTEILQVTEVSSPNQWRVIEPSGSKAAAVRDTKDSTYIKGGFVGQLAYQFQQFKLSPSALINKTEDLAGTLDSVSIRIRASSDRATYTAFQGSYQGSVFAMLVVDGVVNDTIISPFTGNVTQHILNFEPNTDILVPKDAVLTYETNKNSVPWTFADIPKIELRLQGNLGIQVHSVSVELNYTATNLINEPTSLTLDEVEADHVSLSWTDNSGIETGYLIERSLDGVDYFPIGVVGPDVTSFVDLTNISVTHYYYRVRAFNEVFNSDWSNVVDDTTPAYLTAAESPTNFVGLNLTNTSVQLTWVDGGKSDYFELEESADNGSTWTPIVTLPRGINFYEIVDKLPGSSYKYRVRGGNTVGTSSWVTSDNILFPERSFREFLQNEVLQDVVNYFGWYDTVKLPEQEFSVTQTFFAATNMTAAEANTVVRYVDFGIGGNQTYYQRVDSIKVTPALIAEIPEGTFIPEIGAYVAQNPNYVADDGTILVDGAAIGDTVIYLKNSDGSPFLMGRLNIQYYDGSEHIVSNLVSKNITITTDIDYSQTPNDASDVYESITNDALLKIGYTDEHEVPSYNYQQFRDAGRVAAWRFVAYSSVHLTTNTINKTISGFGSVDITSQENQIFENAMKELAIAERTYKARYEFPSEPATPEAVPHINANTYSSPVTVRF